MNNPSLLHLAILFFIVMDSLGNIPIFVSVLRPFDTAKQKKIILRELLISLAIMIFALFFGKGFFSLLHISQASLQIAGGAILFIIAVKMVFATPGAEVKNGNVQDPLIVPLAIPAVAGPAIIATISLYGGSDENKGIVLLAILIAWAATFPILFFSPYLKKILGDNGLTAVERLFGYLIVLIAVDMAIKGLVSGLSA